MNFTKKFTTFLVVLNLLVISFFLLPPYSHAQTDPDLEKRLQEKASQIQQYQEQLNQARGQEKTLKSQLNIIDSQAKITQLKIEETNLKIQQLERQITDLSGRIDRISSSVDTLSQVLLDRITKTYKYGNISIIDLLFSSAGFSDLLERLKYIQVVQANDKKVLYQLQATKVAYNDQKQDKEIRQAEAQKLSQDLETYQKQLAANKAVKEELLRITQNDEAIYQQKIRVAQEEQNAILAIFSGAGNEVTVGHVSIGDTIGHMIYGRSACSSGTHLHFEVHQNNSLSDPNNYLSSTGFSYGDNDGGASEGTISPHGSWSWPIFPNILISQGFGITPYARAGAYNGGPHTGIDMYSSSGLTVKAVVDGTLSRGGIACGGGTLYYKKIDQGNGTAIYYLHVLD